MDYKGQVNVVGASVVAIAGVIGIVIFSAVYASLNTAQVGTAATGILNIVALLLAAVLVIGILGLLAFR
jgi:hypothetical protein